MGGDKTTVVILRLNKARSGEINCLYTSSYYVTLAVCFLTIMRRLRTGTTTTDAKRNKGHTNPANLAKEREISRSSVYL